MQSNLQLPWDAFKCALVDLEVTMEHLGRKRVLTQIIKDKGSCRRTLGCGACPIVCGDSPCWVGDSADPKFLRWKYEQALNFFVKYYKEEDIIETLLD